MEAYIGQASGLFVLLGALLSRTAAVEVCEVAAGVAGRLEGAVVGSDNYLHDRVELRNSLAGSVDS